MDATSWVAVLAALLSACSAITTAIIVGRFTVLAKELVGGDTRAELELAWTKYAMEILSSESPLQAPLREWAIQVVDAQSPVPLTAGATKALLTGDAQMPFHVPMSGVEERRRRNGFVEGVVRQALRRRFPRFSDFGGGATNRGYMFSVMLGGPLAAASWDAAEDTKWYSLEFEFLFPEAKIWDNDFITRWADDEVAPKLAEHLRTQRPDWDPTF